MPTGAKIFRALISLPSGEYPRRDALGGGADLMGLGLSEMTGRRGFGRGELEKGYSRHQIHETRLDGCRLLIER